LATRRTSVTRQIRIIRSALTSVMGALDRLGPALAASTARVAGAASPPRRKMRLSPARRAALKIQGQYMGYLRGLKPRQKVRVKALRQTKGVRAAIAMARKLAA
jgi:hypothetical protein